MSAFSAAKLTVAWVTPFSLFECFFYAACAVYAAHAADVENEFFGFGLAHRVLPSACACLLMGAAQI